MKKILALAGAMLVACAVWAGTNTPLGAASNPGLDAGNTTIRQVWGNGVFRLDEGNPLVGWFEPSVIFSADGETAYMWSLNGFSVATDASCRVWSTPDPGVMPDGMSGWHFPYVTRNPNNGHYFLMMTTEEDGTGEIHAWDATNPSGPWTHLNSGNPVVTRNTSSTANWNYLIFNPSAVFVGSTIHVLIEGLAGSGPMSGSFSLGYSYSTLAAGPQFDANMTSSPVATGAGNAQLIYVPNRNALLTVCGETNNAAHQWTLRARAASLSANLAVASSWVPCPGFGLQSPLSEADPTIAFTTSSNKTFTALMVWNHNQTRSGFQAYADLTLDDFYDLATNPTEFVQGRASFGSIVQAYQINIGTQGNLNVTDGAFNAINNPYQFTARGRNMFRFSWDSLFFGGTPGVTDGLFVLPQSPGGGIIMSSVNAANTAYAPMIWDATSFLYRNGGNPANGFGFFGTVFKAGPNVQFNGTSIFNGIRTAVVSSHSFGSIAAGANSDVAVTVTGCTTGDSVTVNTTDGTNFPAGIVAAADVTAGGTVTVRLTNVTNSSISVGSRSFRVTATSF